MSSDQKKKTATLMQSGSAVVRSLEEQVEKRPYMMIAAAAGTAFGLGALMGSRVGRLLTALCASYAVKELARGEVGQRVAIAVRKGLADITSTDAMRS